MTESLNKRIPLLLAAAVGLVTIGVFSSGLHGQMMFDDYRSIIGNSDIEHFPDVILGSTRPLTELTFFVNYALHGASVVPYHVVNILLHALAAMLLFGVVRRTLLLPQLARSYATAAPWLAASASAAWALHPLQTESVTYIVQRAESMTGMFALLTLYAFVRSATSDDTAARRWSWIAVAACVLGMLSKPVMIVVPPLVRLYDYVFRVSGGRWRRHLGLWATGLIPLVLIVMPNESSSSAGMSAGLLSPWRYLLTQCDVVVHYLRLCVWPTPLCIDYAWQPVDGFGEVWCSAAALAVLVVICVTLATRRQALGFLGCWFILALAPTSSVIPVADLAAERRMYLALAALTVVVTVAGWEGLRRLAAKLSWSQGRMAALAVVPVATVLLVFGGLTVQRNRVYGSEEKMWQSVLTARPENLRARLGLGALALAKGQLAVAETQFEAVLSDLPQTIPADPPSATSTLYSLTRTNLGVLREQQERYVDAEFCFREAIRVSRQNADARVNLGIVLSRKRIDPESRRLWLEALTIEPNHTKAHFCLGWQGLKEGDVHTARKHLEHAAHGRGELAQQARALLANVDGGG